MASFLMVFLAFRNSTLGPNHNALRFDFEDRRRYSDLLVQHCREYGVAILGYCQMTNHVHLILQPSTDDSPSRAMQRLNSEHAQGVQFRLGRSGHLWQGRFTATPGDTDG